MLIGAEVAPYLEEVNPISLAAANGSAVGGRHYFLWECQWAGILFDAFFGHS
jgi:hypothetical protein